ncbi:aBC-type multidrug transport system ATPase and permease components [Eggerthella sp. CAG:209]|nr:aBC-type multidrug transport system ATPase and permease components [Eggerthella sp. CAG:209]
MGAVSFVFQDDRLFKRSLADNVRAGRPDASDAEVLAALHAAQCDDIIAKFPDGVSTAVGKAGVYLSGGERQRIALARAILKGAPIVVLDEATAFADPENEALFQAALATLCEDRTVLMIAHRLSTVVNADRIFVIDRGSVVEQGAHEELVAHGGLYARMWRDYRTSATWRIEGGDSCVA